MVSVDPDEAGGYDASFASDLPFGSYYVKERTTNSAYILSDTEYPVVFEYAGQDAALVQILVNEGEPISNDLLRGRVDGVKVGENPEGGDDVKLSGALIGLFQPDTEEFTEENALLTVTTGEDGSLLSTAPGSLPGRSESHRARKNPPAPCNCCTVRTRS